ncbi:MAG: PorV/PorQ family protein [Candidatus Cloacimonetes bacterium]|nr:PorV/PorQ family protein [Candidatus Cloacimonadota bacterium]
MLSVCLLPLLAVNDDAGTTGFASLKNVYSARAVAMGQSLTGETGNPDGIHFNPASIIKIDGNELGSTFTSAFVGSQGGQLQFLWPKDRFTAWGFALKYVNMGRMERTEVDQNGDLVSTGETFGASNIVASASLAKYISDAIDLGGTLKVIYDQIDNSSATAAILDLGLIHHPVNDRIKVGVSLRNIGFQLTTYSDTAGREKLPFTMAAGITYLFNPRLMGSLDVSKATGENILAKAGVEYELTPAFDLRGGFRTNASDGYNGGTFAFLSGLSLGAGWKWNKYRIDYGVSSYGDLGWINQISLNYEF